VIISQFVERNQVIHHFFHHCRNLVENGDSFLDHCFGVFIQKTPRIIKLCPIGIEFVFWITLNNLLNAIRSMYILIQKIQVLAFFVD